MCAAKSKCRSKFGAIIVNGDIPISSGYNGYPRGIKGVESSGEDTRMLEEHAERNAIYNAARAGICTSHCALIVNGYPCAECARAIIQCGIDYVYYKPEAFIPDYAVADRSNWRYTTGTSKWLFDAVGIRTIEICSS